MRDITILYYSANNQPEGFEEKIIENIKTHAGNLPIISVTHKPTDLGQNIVVGVHDVCYPNLFRQVQIGLREVKTKYVLTCESDVLYPADYFTFEPDGKFKVYRYNNVWVLFPRKGGNKFHYKGFSDGAQLVDKEMWLRDITKCLGDKTVWYNKDEKIKTISYHSNIKGFGDDNVITFKTDGNVRHSTWCSRAIRPKKRLKTWGTIKEIKARMNLK